MESQSKSFFAYRFNEAHYVVAWADDQPSAQYHHPGGEISPGEGSHLAPSTLLWQPSAHRVLTVSVPAEPDEDFLRGELKNAFGHQAAHLQYLAVTADGKVDLTGARKLIVFALEAEEMKSAEEFRSSHGLGEIDVYLPWQPILHSLQRSKAAAERVLLLDVSADGTLLLVQENGATESGQILPWGLKTFGESIRDILKLRFAGSAVRLLFNGVYDFTNTEEAIAEAMIKDMVPALKKAVPDLEGSSLALSLTGFPPGTEWLGRRLAERIKATALVPETDFGGLSALDAKAWAGLQNPPLPIAGLLSAKEFGKDWLHPLAGSLFPLDKAGSVGLKAARLSAEEVDSFTPAEAKREVEEPEPVSMSSTSNTGAAVLEKPKPKTAPKVAAKAPASPKKQPVAKPQVKSAPAPAPAPEPKKSPIGLIAGIAAAVVVLGGGAFFMFGGNKNPVKPPPPSAPVSAPASSTPPPSTAALPPPVVVEDDAKQNDLSTPVPNAVTDTAGSLNNASIGTDPSVTDPTSGDLEISGLDDLNGPTEPQPEPEIVVEPPPPPPPPGEFVIAVEPAGTRIFLDGEQVGVSPFTISELPTGTYTLRLEADGYRTIEKTVELTETSPLFSLENRALERRTGNASIRTEPSGVAFVLKAVDNAQFSTIRGVTPFEASSLPEGAYEVTFQRDGWENEVSTLEIRDRDTSSIAYAYPEGSLSIVSNPSGASVLDRNGRIVGRTPLLLEHLQKGTYDFTLTYAGHEDFPLTTAVTPNKKTDTQVNLIDLNGVLMGAQIHTLPRIVDDNTDSRLIETKYIDAEAAAVEVIVTLDRNGEIETIAMKEPQNERVERLAARTIKKLRFLPAERNGQAVRSRVVVPLVFYQEERFLATAQQLLKWWKPVVPFTP